MGASLEDIEDLVHSNPQGVAEYLFDLVCYKPVKVSPQKA